MHKYRIVHEDGTVLRWVEIDKDSGKTLVYNPGETEPLITIDKADESLVYCLSYLEEKSQLLPGWDHTSSLQRCDDCGCPHGWHYTCYSGGLQGCSYEGCKCTGFFAYIEDPKEVAE